VSDPLNYYVGAHHQLVFGDLDAWNNRRPITALLLAVQLAAVGDDLRLALLAKAILLGLSLWLLTRSVVRTWGLASALVLLAAVYAVGSAYVVTTNSEVNGLLFGVLATDLLLRAGARRDPALGVAGLGLLTLASLARPGAVLILPLLVLWCAAMAGRGRRVLVAAGALAAVVGSVLFNSFLLHVYGAGFGVGNGNLSCILYGLSTGEAGTAWTHEMRFEGQGLSLEEINRELFRGAVDNLRQRPQDFALGVARGAGLFAQGLVGHAVRVFRFLPQPQDNLLFVALLVLVGAARMVVHRSRPEVWLVVLAAAGMALAGPIVFVDIGPRAFAATYPLLFLLPAFAVARLPGLVATTGESSAPGREIGADAADASWRWSLGLGVGVALVLLVGPAVAHRLRPERHLVEQTSPAGTVLGVVRPGLPRLDIQAPGSPEPTFVPRVRVEDLARHLDHAASPRFGEVPGRRLVVPGSVLLVYALHAAAPRVVWVVVPPGVVGQESMLVRFHGHEVHHGGFDYLYVNGVEIVPPSRRHPG
jgi:hypothetical protein